MKNDHPLILGLRANASPYEKSSPIMLDEVRLEDVRARIKKFQPQNDRQGAAYFCIWGVLDDRRCVWFKGAFRKSIQERGPESNANQKIFLSWWHDLRDPIGRPLKIVEDDIGAYVEYELDDVEAVPNAKRAQAQVLKSGTVNGWSFGFDYIWDKMEVIEWPDARAENGKGEAVAIREADLFEIAPLTMPSIRQTFSVRSMKEFGEQKLLLKEDVEDFIKSLPRPKQLELRQLLSRYDTLAEFKPDDPLKQTKPDENVIQFGESIINLNKL